MPQTPDYSLYVITERWGGRSHLEVARAALAGGATVIQLREKELPPAAVAEEALAIARLCRQAGATFIVNDWVEAARAWGADGVHLGERDQDPEVARRRLGAGAIIGLSVSGPEAARAASSCADYLGVGPVYGTTTKPDAREAIGLAGLRRIVQAALVPVVAIGGITAQTAGEAMRAGAAGVAVISAVSRAADMEDAARRLCRAIAESRKLR